MTQAMRRISVAILLLLASPAAADLSPFKPPRPPVYTAPGRLFQLEIGPQWHVGPNEGRDDTVEFQLDNSGRGSALLRIRRRPVAEGAQAKQLMVRALEERRRSLPHLSDVVRGEKMLRSGRASAFTGLFWWQGNAQYKRVVEEVFVVMGKDGFELHLECFPPLYQAMASEREAIYQSFVPRPSSDHPEAVEQDDEEIHFDNVPF